MHRLFSILTAVELTPTLKFDDHNVGLCTSLRHPKFSGF